MKWILIVIIVLLVGLFAATKIMSKDIPTGESGPVAKALADKILNRLNKPAWDSLQYVSWTFFRGEHHYVWDKMNNKAIVTWPENKVILDLNDWFNQSYAYNEEGTMREEQDRQAALKTAWSFWCNDSFWLYAPYKLRDQGIKRSLITEDGKQGLLVSYESGGVTPGDSYLWWVDDTGLPTSYDMWTSIIPIKGINATWTNWEKLAGGSMVAKSHKLGPLEMSLSNIKAGSTLESVGSNRDAFQIDLSEIEINKR